MAPRTRSPPVQTSALEAAALIRLRMRLSTRRPQKTTTHRARHATQLGHTAGDPATEKRWMKIHSSDRPLRPRPVVLVPFATMKHVEIGGAFLDGAADRQPLSLIHISEPT